MKIMINLLSSRSGGALSYIRNLIPLVAKKFSDSADHTLSLLLHATQKTELGNIAASVEYVEVEEQINGYARALWEIVHLPRIVNERKVDVLFTPYQLAPSIKTARTIVMIRNMEPFLFDKYRYDFKNYLRNIILRRASIKTLKQADRVIAVSKFPASYCLDTLRIPSSNLSIVYHGRDKQFSPEPLPTDSSTLASLGITKDYFFTCGSMLPYRRCEIIIEAFSRWVGDKECELVIAGSSNDQRYQSLIQDLIHRSPAAAKIRWLGQVKLEPMRVLYRRCKLFVTATDIEACPNIGIEALSSGCYIVSSDNAPLPEIFAEAADYFQADKIQTLVERFEWHFTRQDNLNAKALSRADNFSWESCSEQTFKILTDQGGRSTAV
jgi:glycosyltransferase involved in cell wall biosynthesis